MPKMRSPQYTVINDLESLSTEVDERATRFLPPLNLIAEYCNLFKEAATKISNCSDLKEVVHPPPPQTFLESTKNEVPNTSIPKAETDRDQRLVVAQNIDEMGNQSHRVSPENHAEGKQNVTISIISDIDNVLNKVESLGKKCKGSYTVVAESLPKEAKGSQNVPKVDSVKKIAEVQKTEENNKRSCRVTVENQLKGEIRKTEENNKRSCKVLVENQFKAKASQKKNEKLVTQMQKRLLSEKEKQRLEKEKELLKKKIDLQKSKTSKENAFRPPHKTRPKETNEGKRTLQEINDIKKTKEENECKRAKIVNESKEQHTLKNSVTSVKVLKQNGSCANIVAKTPDKKMSSHNSSDTYELTPVPDSSTYDFSDDDDNPPPGKYVPSWASGAQLKSHLLQQYYNPIDPDILFGCCFNATPDLAAMFNIRKKEYMKRTSSAVWDHPPLHHDD